MAWYLVNSAAVGDGATVTVGTTTTGEPGTNASVTNSGTSSAAVLNFTIPKGDKGDTGATGAPGANGAPGQAGANGAAATVTVGTTTTGNAGTNASVTNSGTSSAAVLNFTIPKGDKGDKGDTGAPGATGTPGATGATGQGVPTGGAARQVLTKNSATSYDTKWSNPFDYYDTGVGSIDPDSYTTSGIYYGGWKIPSSTDNAYGYLEVKQLSNNANFVTQTFRSELADPALYIRNRKSGSWGSWARVTPAPSPALTNTPSTPVSDAPRFIRWHITASARTLRIKSNLYAEGEIVYVRLTCLLTNSYYNDSKIELEAHNGNISNFLLASCFNFNELLVFFKGPTNLQFSHRSSISSVSSTLP